MPPVHQDTQAAPESPARADRVAQPDLLDPQGSAARTERMVSQAGQDGPEIGDFQVHRDPVDSQEPQVSLESRAAEDSTATTEPRETLAPQEPGARLARLDRAESWAFLVDAALRERGAAPDPAARPEAAATTGRPEPPGPRARLDPQVLQASQAAQAPRVMPVPQAPADLMEALAAVERWAPWVPAALLALLARQVLMDRRATRVRLDTLAAREPQGSRESAGPPARPEALEPQDPWERTARPGHQGSRASPVAGETRALLDPPDPPARQDLKAVAALEGRQDREGPQGRLERGGLAVLQELQVLMAFRVKGALVGRLGLEAPLGPRESLESPASLAQQASPAPGV